MNVTTYAMVRIQYKWIMECHKALNAAQFMYEL